MSHPIFQQRSIATLDVSLRQPQRSDILPPLTVAIETTSASGVSTNQITMPGSDGEVAEDVGALSKQYPEDSVSSALTYKPRPDDVFVVSFSPLCGAEFVQLVVYHILHERAPPSSVLERAAHLPLLEMQGAEAVAIMPRPGSVRTHLHFHLLPQADCAKYIYIARNPYDCCAFLFEEVFNAKKQEWSPEDFQAFFEDFVEGRATCGDYLAELLYWYKRRFDDNVLLITYEELLGDKKPLVLRIADFLTDEGECGQKLRRNRRLLERICSQAWNEGVWESMEPRRVMLEAAAVVDAEKPEWAKQFLKAQSDAMLEKQTDETKKPEIRLNMPCTADMRKRMLGRIEVVAGRNCNVMSLWEWEG
ncbi:hypothetical protein V5799_027210 [Amblyomma americanum]|uniref:Sulfotransferase domain-containing protein n=1 Tax=Amblyomma americanum TaxID=6943 RepID=A0AAQ4DGD3_AMBAM